MADKKKALFILRQLENSGFKAYLAGGCVRDMLMGREPHDFDITTNALPKQTMDVFSDLKVVHTGIKHGTVTVIADGEPFEITTFRVDGCYSDSRHPDSVRFTSELCDDLSRRDLTVNAIAMDRNGDIFDPFGGQQDISDRIIRCVGDPEKRFGEDALRILRTVRFASTLGFTIEENTASAANRLRGRLENVSAERIREELTKLICGENVVSVMLKHRDIIAQAVPELVPCFDFDQRSKYHKYDVYEHIVRAVDAMPMNSPLLRTTMLFHDLGKPHTFKLDENGTGHFKHHAEVGAEIALNVMKRLKYDNDTIKKIHTLILRHSEHIFNEKEMRLSLSALGPELFRLLMEVKKADNMAKREFVLNENRWFDRCSSQAEELVANGFCLTLGQLAVNGNDLKTIGFEGRAIGAMLEKLLRAVVVGELENESSVLLKKAMEGAK